MSSFAIIVTGGKQYKVSEGQRISFERLPGEVGSAITFDRVLLVAGDKTVVGTPTVPGASVTATIEEQGRDRKVTIIKFKPKTHYRRTRGHRQSFTRVLVKEIKLA